MPQLNQAVPNSISLIHTNSARALKRSRDAGLWERFTRRIAKPRRRLYIGWFGGVQIFSKEVQS